VANLRHGPSISRAYCQHIGTHSQNYTASHLSRFTKSHNRAVFPRFVPACEVPLGPLPHITLRIAIGAPIILGRVPHCQRMRMSMCYELISSAERGREREREGSKQTAFGRSTQCTNTSDPITTTSELLPKQNSVTAHARRLAIEIHRSKSAVRLILPVRRRTRTTGRDRRA
jgi:hypothetical protein